MNDPDRLDLSALDPLRDPAHWRAVVGETMARVNLVLERRVPREDPFTLIASWARPVLLTAAGILTLLIPAEIALEAREAQVERLRRLVALSEQVASDVPAPTGAEFLRALGERRVP
jgi:hypothetical protein